MIGPFHNNLNAFLKANNITGKEMSDRLGISQQMMSYIRLGREPSYELLVKIAAELNVTIDFLIGAKPKIEKEHEKMASVIALQLKCEMDNLYEKVIDCGGRKILENGMAEALIMRHVEAAKAAILMAARNINNLSKEDVAELLK